jgi:hypothetical protein
MYRSSRSRFIAHLPRSLNQCAQLLGPMPSDLDISPIPVNFEHLDACFDDRAIRCSQMRSLNLKRRSATLHLACNSPRFNGPRHSTRKPPIQLAAAVPLHGIYSIDDWEAAIPKKNCNEATHYSIFVRRLLSNATRLAPGHASIATFQHASVMIGDAGRPGDDARCGQDCRHNGRAPVSDRSRPSEC